MKDREAVTTNGRAVFYASMWNDLRQAALDQGWALALHGSLASDMDIIAVPWNEDSKPAWDMIFALKNCFDNPKKILVSEQDKPNGRKAISLNIYADFYLDINIMDRRVSSVKAEEVTSNMGSELTPLSFLLEKGLIKPGNTKFFIILDNTPAEPTQFELGQLLEEYHNRKGGLSNMGLNSRACPKRVNEPCIHNCSGICLNFGE